MTKALALATAATALLAVSGSRAHADGNVSMYTPTGTLLIELGDDGTLARLVGAGHRGAVRCFGEREHVRAMMGAGDTEVVGCFVAIKRDGTLTAPPAATATWSLSHLSAIRDGELTATAGVAPDTLELRIGGPVGDAIGLWVDCGEHDAPGTLRCDENNGMGGQYSWDIRFVLGKGGTVSRAAPY